jgi:hypothetical protein
VETRLPGWDWLVRSDETRGYFANIVSPESRNEDGVLDMRLPGALVTPTYAETPEKALLNAFFAADLANRGRSVPTAETV